MSAYVFRCISRCSTPSNPSWPAVLTSPRLEQAARGSIVSIARASLEFCNFEDLHIKACHYSETNQLAAVM